ncbi:hypothetical protein [Streptomyces sp. NPDC048637]|uniref:hypothetical protein n=1 Tax=Streptomyces sp. NPDC048637 TaxID=3155636 RepID=UPI0034432A5D
MIKKSVLRRLTKDGDDNAIIYVDQALMTVLKIQCQPAGMEGEARLAVGRPRPRLRARWIHASSERNNARWPQDAGQVSARWRSTRQRLDLPQKFRIHDWRHSKVTNDLEAGENPVEVSVKVRHHSPSYAMDQHGKRRVEGASEPASGTAGRTGWG